ncbi:MAG: YlbD family protein [Bacilli bacterium]|nr:YlbD family protein [Bacilli bacterium]
MDKKEAFKSFAKSHPELVSSIKSGDASWQKLYEIYDIYGEDDRAWNTYFNKNDQTSTMGLNNITNIVKNIDMDSVQKHINTAQKALGLVSELTGKGASATISPKGPVTPRPINKFFED